MSTLNYHQNLTVTLPLSGQYQILAGPGTGKTKTLTHRIAHLIQSELIPPQNIIVLTFTNSAAREMKNRLQNLLPTPITKLNIGTFHGECFKYLIKYGSYIGLSKRLSIIDPVDQRLIIKNIVSTNEFKEKLQSAKIDIDLKGCVSRISELKSHGYTNANDFAKLKNNQFDNPIGKYIFNAYQSELESNDLVDFDDIIIKCRDLLTKFPHIVSNIQAVLVDEFQDSNIVQLEVTQLFANATNNITIIGDPDQSIYKFRNAQPENILLLRNIYPNTRIIYLEENYRSTQPILDLSMSIINKDEKRISSLRKLKSKSDICNISPTIIEFNDDIGEAKFVINQINYLVNCSGGLFSYKDIAILTRNSFPGKQCELELGFNRIPYRVFGGFKFWDRIEVKVVVDYLRVINNDNDKAAMKRTINVPSRGIGDKSMEKIFEEKERTREETANNTSNPITALDHLKQLAFGNKSKVTSKVKNSLIEYLQFIDKCKSICKEIDNPVNAITTVIDKIISLTLPDINEKRQESIDLIKSHVINTFQEPTIDTSDTDIDISDPLQRFLLSLSLGVDNDPKNDNKVTISTIHSAKGLEWPIVFCINTIDEHILRSGEDGEAEERRLLFVSLTRAKALLYITYPRVMTLNGRFQGEPSRFLPPTDNKHIKYLLNSKGITNLKQEDFNNFAIFLERPLPKIAKGEFKHQPTMYGGFMNASDMLNKPEVKEEKDKALNAWGNQSSIIFKKQIKKESINQPRNQFINKRSTDQSNQPSSTSTTFTTPKKHKSMPTTTTNSTPIAQSQPQSLSQPVRKKTLGVKRRPVTNKLPFT